MSTETLTKLNPKILINPKLDPKGSDTNLSDSKYHNIKLSSARHSKKTNAKICVNKLKNKLKVKEKSKIIENRVFVGLILSVVAVLFFVAT